MLLSAILSDTLNLQGPTTTSWDKLMVAVLVEICEMTSGAEIQSLVTKLFKAKSRDLVSMAPMELVEGDQKIFRFKENFEGSLGFSVLETTDDKVLLQKAPELLSALRQDKINKELGVSLLAVVNIVSLKATLLLCGDAERSLAEAAFPSIEYSLVDEHTMDLGNSVSRKKVLVPAVKGAIKRGWAPETVELVHTSRVSFGGK
ncbi:hypothetical protein EON65_50315 [archaeon]|nr:MAG: hypothetical protein EON65_50315 [archaeon]